MATDCFAHWFQILRCSWIGAFMGAIPGIAVSIIDWISYAHALRTEKGARQSFGKGDIRGVIAAESATNAREGGALCQGCLCSARLPQEVQARHRHPPAARLAGITDTALLRASHIVPWSECSDEQRLDVHNGLLLSALWDAAFDKGLVSFADDGKPLASPELSEIARRILALEQRQPFTASAMRTGRN